MVQLDIYITPSTGAPPAHAHFAEPDWRGDRDYPCEIGDGALESEVDRLAAEIRIGAEGGWLDAYYARRAAFDLQSIRAQIARELGRRPAPMAEDQLRAIRSRADRLQACLRALRPRTD